MMQAWPFYNNNMFYTPYWFEINDVSSRLVVALFGDENHVHSKDLQFVLDD